jgi:hypothetical protein
LQEGFYKAVFNDGIWELGLDTLSAKLNIYQSGGNTDLINTYLIFGDPALRIPSPYRVSLSPDTREGTAFPGKSLTYSFLVTNESDISDTVDLKIVDNIWPVDFPSTVGPLSAGESRWFYVTVNIPSGANDGMTDTASIIVTSRGDRSRTGTGTVSTHVTTSESWVSLFMPLVQK